MILSWDSLFKLVVSASCVFVMVLVTVSPAGASSFGCLNVFGYPTTTGLTGLGSTNGSAIDGNTLSGLTSGYGYLSASTSSGTPTSQYTGIYGTGSNGLWSGISFGYPTATHDASTVSYASSKAFEIASSDDAVSFPDISVSLGSNFPTISSDDFDMKYMESVQFQLTTESDTMPVSGFVFPASFYSF
jgi:hypothetical protein